MTTKTKAILTVTGVLLLALLVRRCDRPRVTPTAPGKLAPTEKEHITVSGHTVTTITAEKTVRQYAPGRVDISIGKNGKVTVRVREFGLCAQPGLGYGYNGKHAKAAVDLKLLYYHRAGLHAGLSLDFNEPRVLDVAKPIVGASYVPFTRFSNTSIVVSKEFLPNAVFVYVRLGF